MNSNNFLSLQPLLLIFCLKMMFMTKLTASQWDPHWVAFLQTCLWIIMKEIDFRNLP